MQICRRDAFLRDLKRSGMELQAQIPATCDQWLQRCLCGFSASFKESSHCKRDVTYKDGYTVSTVSGGQDYTQAAKAAVVTPPLTELCSNALLVTRTSAAVGPNQRFISGRALRL